MTYLGKISSIYDKTIAMLRLQLPQRNVMLPTLVDLSFDHFSEPVVPDLGNRHDFVLGLHVARQDRPQSHCVGSLHHDHKANGTGGGSEHNGILGNGGGGNGQHEGKVTAAAMIKYNGF